MCASSLEFPTLSGCGEAHPCCFLYSPGLGSLVLVRDLNKYDLGTIRISSLFVAFNLRAHRALISVVSERYLTGV